MPIIVNRIQWEDIYQKFVNYIKYAASCTYRQFHTESIEDLIQEGQLVLYKCWVAYGDKPEVELHKLIKTAIWRKLQEVSGKHRFNTIDIPTLQEQGHEPGYEEDWDSQIEEQSKLQQVAQLLVDEPTALTILKEFVNPSARTLWEAKMDVERKAMLRAQGYMVIVPLTVQPTKKAIQRAMGISKLKFDWNFKTLKEAMMVVYHSSTMKKCKTM